MTTAAPTVACRADSSTRSLLRELFRLAIPVWIEQSLHILVGVCDTFLADHLPTRANDAGAAVGTITYFLWFFGLLTASVGVGSTAIISRARGARHRRLANQVTGQSVSAAVVIGAAFGLCLYVFADPIIRLAQLSGPAHGLALSYLRMLSLTLPFTMLMFIAGSCQRGGGDTATPAVVMVVVDVINVAFSFGLCRGYFGLPRLGFNGIAIGTVIAYVAGGLMQSAVLLRGRDIRGRPTVKLFLHRLRPHWHTIRRLVRVGTPALIGDTLSWLANFGVIAVINRADSTNVMSAAHMATIRIESFSFLSGMAFSMAAATMVGTSLGMKDPARAKRSAWVAYGAGGGVMTFCGLLFILVGHYPATWLCPRDQNVIALTTQCLRITGFIQCGFAAHLVLGGALRGAGDTLWVTVYTLSTILLLRLPGVLIVGGWLHLGLAAVWTVMAAELFLRGVAVFLRFQFGGWRRIQV